jgi:hypothetical protein
LPSEITFSLNSLPSTPSMEFTDGSLSGNLSDLYKKLRTELIKARLEANNYQITSIREASVTAKYVPPSVNPTEQQALDKFRTLCETEATIIARAVFQYIKAAKQALRVKVPHGTSATDLSSIIAAHKTTPNLSTEYFTIEPGGTSTPKGLDIE